MSVKKITISCTVNNKSCSFKSYPMARLTDVLRENLKLTGTKEGCGEGECGACMVIIDNELVNSCLVPVSQVINKNILTIEGIKNKRLFKSIEKAFVLRGGAQCGFCTPGMVIATFNLLSKNKKPSKPQIKLALSGNLCRCTGYSKITDSVLSAIKEIGERV